MKHVLLALIAFAPLAAFADAKSDFAKIDATLQTCLDQPDNGSTYGMNMCIGAANDAANVQLNKIYSNAVAPLKKTPNDPDSVETLRRLVKSQRAWIAFRDAQSELRGIEMLGGSGESQVVLGTLYDMTKTRALELSELFGRSL